MVTVLVLLGAGLLIGALVALLIQKQKEQKARQAPPPPSAPKDPFASEGDTTGDPRTIKAGDMIDWGTERTWIRGTLRLAEGGYTWSEHFLEVEGGKRWLTVEEDPDVQLSLWTGRPDVELTPHSKTLEFEGTTYKLDERGTAAYRSEGTTGLKSEGGCDYADYESADGRMLSFERFDHGGWEASTGTKILPGSFTIYPGS
ncbi:DUF4178 domain-containing protein [Nocardiopsis sp. NRRL B-16309]|uniref:DUF4178 domain-containing protein n=1 Tax=Nocardiopsis sp. NRRL B-16309 TaxID=1519494 RepID=UPI0006AE0BC6|nr:DUF4178 domain-containing protein [Nocardiopsis sp. NRRL B-16309]KOX17714.1 hypothetical protein ADL05_08745 [Nocardiopsis sp. NRRL B-16309]